MHDTESIIGKVLYICPWISEPRKVQVMIVSGDDVVVKYMDDAKIGIIPIKEFENLTGVYVRTIRIA